MDLYDTSESISNFIVNNYKQALSIISGTPVLKKRMEEEEIEGTHVFDTWLEEEHEYLGSLSKEPPEETLEMEYYQRLQEYYKAESEWEKVGGVYVTYRGDDPTSAHGTSAATHCCHAKERRDQALGLVFESEIWLGVEKRWAPDMDEWKRVEGLVKHHWYQCCLDDLEGLIVACMFELSKMNMSQTGYKLQCHIANALCQHSQAIWSTLDQYNSTTAEVLPDHRNLSWDEVVEYAFLADFDLLRDARQDIRKRPWSNQACRKLMHQHFKIVWAYEEIKWLDIEIK
ncbi:hypothetical protein P691DRAFT_769073 [Macrolepiota fuliginosa MF-IS2]|uniref:Uncharacterized protein n=1 Tax=Macrolepiota fuliginosa MF-IS2 TaxID=1400762 RepID=A0A9P5WW39_9AGAR|nr:hypothetical protein P691DRAFT_769073 [Macrolepiota fuliginosa MF-IS2]